jgi:hypothetical protein
MTNIRRVMLGMAMLAALLSACTSGREDGRRMNQQEAANRADAILDATLRAVRPQVHWAHGETTVGSCDLTRRRIVTTQISEQRRGSFVGVIERFWRDSRYRIKSINASKEFPAVYAQSRDGFGISLIVRGAGQAYFEVDTPCVARSGVREATAVPDGPDYRGGPVPRPNVYDDFWSSTDVLPSSSPSAL